MLDHDGRHQPAHRRGCASGRWSAATATASPSVLAKITSTVDVISGGRLDWGIGAGWYENEYKGYGFEFPPAEGPHRHAARDAWRSCAACGPSPRPPSTASTTSSTGAQCDPKPLQSPHPPIWIGGGGEQLTLRVVARYADCSNFGGKPDEWARKREILQGSLRGRRAATRRPSARRGRPRCSSASTEAEIVAAGSRSFWGEPFESWRAGNLVGTPEQVCEKIQTYIDLGCTGFIPWCTDYPEHRDDGAVRHAGDAQLPLTSASRPRTRLMPSAHAA